MFELNKLSRLVKKRKRVGRGGARGGMSGKGHDGQKSRSGGTIRIGFEGGQMPLYRRLPKRGFNNEPFQDCTVTVGLNQIDKKFDDGELVNKESLVKKGIIKSQKSTKNFLVKILGTGSLNKKLVIEANAFSESAQKRITELGGEARLI